MLIHLALLIASTAFGVLGRDNAPAQSGSCSANFKICAPPGVKTDTLGPIGPTWADLYQDIVNVVSNYGITQRSVGSTTSDLSVHEDGVLCCANVADCLLVPIYDIAMCWDRFTTNVYFEDGTFGTVVTGEFNTTDGASINLVYGSYTMKDGTTGNIYGGAASSLTKLDTSTMPIPSPWTSSGEGSAIPVTGLGTTASLSVVTTTIPPTTIPASTESSITILDTLTDCHHCPPYNTTISGPMQSEGTRPAITSVISTGVITPTISPNVGVSLFPYSTYCFIGPFIAAFAAQLVI